MKRSRLVLTAVLCGALAAAGCSSSSNSASTGSTKSSTRASGSSSSSGRAITAADIALGLQYTGGKAGKADTSLPAVTVGFLDQEGGSPSDPELDHAADAAVSYVNNQLGGIQGHPMKLDKCLVQAEEDGQKCAAQFLANHDVKSVVFALSIYGNGTFYKTVNGKFPVLVSVAALAADYNTPDVYELDGGGSGVLNKYAQDTKAIGAKTVSIVSSNNPAGKFITGTVLIPELKALGIKSKAVYISDTATTPDYVSALTASGAAKADAVMLVPVAAAGCVSLYDAMQQLSIKKPVVTDFWCSNDPMPAHTGGGPTNWQISALADNPLLASPETTEFKDAMTAAGHASDINIGSTPRTFGDVLTMAKFANAIGYDKLTPAAYKQQILDFKGPMFMVPGAMACGQNTVNQGICGDSTPGSVYVDGAWKATAVSPLPAADK